MLPSHTITPRRAPLFTRGAIARPTTDTVERRSGKPSNRRPDPPRKCAHQRDRAPASSIVESVPEPAPRAPLATNERPPTYDAHRDSYRRIRLQRTAPLGPRGARGRAQAPRHVHRLDRPPGPHALPLGDHRQRGRRGPGRPLRHDRRAPAPRPLRLRRRQRPRHPRRHRARTGPDGRRGRLHQAPRRR